MILLKRTHFLQNVMHSLAPNLRNTVAKYSKQRGKQLPRIAGIGYAGGEGLSQRARRRERIKDRLLLFGDWGRLQRTYRNNPTGPVQHVKFASFREAHRKKHW